MMVKALLKKQFMELFKSYFVNRKTGKAVSKSRTVMYLVLFSSLLVGIGSAFYGSGVMLVPALTSMNLDWLYFAMMGFVAMLLGTFGSAFNTYAGIYHAKDNELLLSMPIPPMKILVSRITGMWALSLLYEAIVIVPSSICYWVYGNPTPLGVAFTVLLWFVLSLVIASITCLLGWLVALISNNLKNKNVITVILSLAFFGIYYFVCFKFNELLQQFITNAEQIGKTVKTAVFPAYAFGNAAMGSSVHMLIFTAIAVACFTLMCIIMAKSFIKITTSVKADKKTVYKEKTVKVNSVKSALLHKELKRFTSSSTYMMNCGFGLVIPPVVAVFAIIKEGTITDLLTNTAAFLNGMAPVLAVGIGCMMYGMNDISAPSVSLEGKNIWIPQSLPVDAYDVLEAKVNMHVLLNSFPAIICTTVFAVILKVDMITAILMIVASWIFVWFIGVLGITLNLKMPNLNWTNETIPVKQSMAVCITLFGGWILNALMMGGYYLLESFIKPKVYLGLIIMLYAFVTLLLNQWLKTKGKRIFESL